MNRRRPCLRAMGCCAGCNLPCVVWNLSWEGGRVGREIYGVRCPLMTAEGEREQSLARRGKALGLGLALALALDLADHWAGTGITCPRSSGIGLSVDSLQPQQPRGKCQSAYVRSSLPEPAHRYLFSCSPSSCFLAGDLPSVESRLKRRPGSDTTQLIIPNWPLCPQYESGTAR